MLQGSFSADFVIPSSGTSYVELGVQCLLNLGATKMNFTREFIIYDSNKHVLGGAVGKVRFAGEKLSKEGA